MMRLTIERPSPIEISLPVGFADRRWKLVRTPVISRRNHLTRCHRLATPRYDHLPRQPST